jgi:hypothetical protein
MSHAQDLAPSPYHAILHVLLISFITDDHVSFALTIQWWPEVQTLPSKSNVRHLTKGWMKGTLPEDGAGLA